MDKSISNYLAKIGRKGGLKSKRRLTPEQARRMVKVREAKRLYKKFHSLCFWSYDPHYNIQSDDIDWLCDQLMKNGNQKTWAAAHKLLKL